ncbi:MAG: LytR/AlgR family response regulator transcription factor, partial [Bacteroidia bacterium]
LVRALEQKTMVIFTTAYSEYAITSYELNAIDYLLKPINYKRFSSAIQKAQEYYNYIQKKDNNAEKYIYVRADFSLVKIDINDILYIEGLADYLKIYIQNRKTLVVRMTMKEMLEKLPSDNFIRVHRSFILPFNRILAVRNNQIILEDNEIPIGKTYTDEFYNRYRPT